MLDMCFCSVAVTITADFEAMMGDENISEN